MEENECKTPQYYQDILKTYKATYCRLLKENECLSNENKKLKQKFAISLPDVVDLTDMNSICRICLKKSSILKPLNNTINFENPEMSAMKISEVLASVEFELIEENSPDKICVKCMECLKLVAIFKHTYAKSTEILNLYKSGVCKEIEQNDHDYTYTPVKMKQKTHTCPICFKEFKLSLFRPHIHKHKDFAKYLKGPKVSRKAKFFALPRKTESLINKVEKLHECPFCHKEFEAESFLVHVEDHLKNDQFSCNKCGRMFSKRSYLLQHTLTHKKELPYNCKFCNKGFVTKKNYEYHLLTHSHKKDDLPYKCEYCPRKFYNPSHLTRHKTIHLENCSYSSKYRRKRCSYCLQGFRNKQQFKLHQCNWTSLRLKTCSVCQKSFATLKSFNNHMRMKHAVVKKIKRVACLDCNKFVVNITYHRKKMHPNSVKKSLCSICGLYVVDINRHHFKHVPIRCKTCNKAFSHPTALSKHLKIHTNMKPYLCTFCPKTFNVKYNLQVHERIHKGDKCHVCPICQKGFLESSYLKKHIKVHQIIKQEDEDLVLKFSEGDAFDYCK